MKRVAVVVLNYCSAELTRRCVEDLQRQEGVELDIIVVDNASPREGEAEKLSALGQTLIVSGHNGGYNAGNNIGLRLAAERGHRLALIANPDMQFPDRSFVSRLAEAIEESGAAAAGGAITDPEGHAQNPLRPDDGWTCEWRWLADLMLRRRASHVDTNARSKICFKLCGACLMLDLVEVSTLGWLDEGLFLYAEEAVLAAQLRRAGMKAVFVPEARAVHAHQKTTSDPRERYAHWLRSRLYFIRNHAPYGPLGRALGALGMRLHVATFLLLWNIKHRAWRA